MVVKVNDGNRMWNALVVKRGEEPNPERLQYLFNSFDFGDQWDEREFQIYRDKVDGSLLAIPRPVR